MKTRAFGFIVAVLMSALVAPAAHAQRGRQRQQLYNNGCPHYMSQFQCATDGPGGTFDIIRQTLRGSTTGYGGGYYANPYIDRQRGYSMNYGFQPRYDYRRGRSLLNITIKKTIAAPAQQQPAQPQPAQPPVQALAPKAESWLNKTGFDLYINGQKIPNGVIAEVADPDNADYHGSCRGTLTSTNEDHMTVLFCK